MNFAIVWAIIFSNEFYCALTGVLWHLYRLVFISYISKACCIQDSTLSGPLFKIMNNDSELLGESWIFKSKYFNHHWSHELSLVRLSHILDYSLDLSKNISICTLFWGFYFFSTYMSSSQYLIILKQEKQILVRWQNEFCDHKIFINNNESSFIVSGMQREILSFLIFKK